MYRTIDRNIRWNGSHRDGQVIRSEAIGRKHRENNQQRRPDRDDTFGADADTPEANLQSITHGAALH